MDGLPPMVMDDLLDESEIVPKYLAIFIDETELSLDSMAETLLALESGGCEEELKQLLITAHRIKGSAASIGLNRAAKLAHLMEDLLQKLVDDGRPMTPPLVDAMLKCADGLRAHIEVLKNGDQQGDRFAELATELLRAQTDLAAEEKSIEKTSAAGTVTKNAAGKLHINKELRDAVAAEAPLGMTTLIGVVNFQPELMLSGLKAQLLYEKLLGIGNVCYFHPQPEHLEELECVEGISFGLATDR